MQKDKRYYDDFFTRYPVDVHDSPDRFRAVSKLLSGKVLDVACGTGTLSDYYAGEYFGIDISDVAVANARQVRRKDARFEVLDMTNPGVGENEVFHCFYVGEFLEHIENDTELFKNILRMSGWSGRVVVSVPNGERVPDESHCRTFTVPQIRRDYSKYGRVLFHEWEGFADRILFSIELGQKPQNDLTLVMIAKDEEKGIERAILSALPLVGRVVVSVDSATTDKTAEIAKMYADELKTHEWKNNFSEARNFAQKNVDSKWTLCLDGHEYIEKTGNLEETLKSDADGILITMKMENGLTFMYPRIFRSYLRFENAVHNAIDCKKTQFVPDFVIVHDRANLQSFESSEARATQRDRMIPDVSNELLKKDPKNQRALFNMGNWHMTKSQYSQAVKMYKRCLKLTPSPDEKYFLLAQIGIAHQLLGHNLRATWAFFELEKLIPNRWETKRLLGGIYLQREQYRKASEYLVFALEPNKKQYLYQLFGQDLSEIWDLIAMCFSELDQPAKSIVAWNQAIEFTDDKLRKNFFRQKASLSKLLLRS